MQTQAYISLALSALAGSIPFGWLIAKLWGVEDLRKVGSANVGATNVVRTAGVLPGALTFLLDFAKGVLPVLYFQDSGIPTLWLGLAAVLGHCFSPFLKFRGGKGVSTTLGAVTAFSPWLGGASIAIYLIALATTRVSALGSLFAMLTLTTGALLFLPSTGEKIAITLIVFVVLARHRENWDKLLGAAAILFLTFQLNAPTAHAAEAPLLDFRGKTVEANSNPGRIVALMPAIAETVVSLGFGKNLVGAPDYSRLPPNFKNVVNVGPYNRPSVEAIYGTHPDLIFASMDGNDLAIVTQLEKLKLRVVTLNSQSMKDILRSMTIIATALGSPENKEILRLRAALTTPTRPTGTPKRVFVQVGWEPLVTVSKHTFIHELITLAGGKNVFADEGLKYPRPNPEEVIARNPDTFVICNLTDDGKQAQQAKEYWLRFTKLDAIKKGRVYIVPGDWIAKPNLSLLNGLAELKRIL